LREGVLAITLAEWTGDTALVLSGVAGFLHWDWWYPVVVGAIAALLCEASQGFVLIQHCGSRPQLAWSAVSLQRVPTRFPSFRPARTAPISHLSASVYGAPACPNKLGKNGLKSSRASVSATSNLGRISKNSLRIAHEVSANHIPERILERLISSIIGFVEGGDFSVIRFP